MKTTIILTLICLLCFIQPSFSHDVENSKYTHLFTTLFVLEGMALMYGAVSMLDFGPQIVGSTYGLFGTAILLAPIIWALSDTTVSHRSLALPQLSIPYAE